MISPFTIQRILDTARIDDVLADFISLKKRGANLIANCPFHNEKTPSFVVSPAKGIYKCFGCSAAGNSVKFVMEYEKLSYPEALRYLAKKYNIEVEELHSETEAKEIIDLRESLLIALEYAKERFQYNLWQTEEGKTIALSYYKERGFSDEIIKQFQLGYCLDQWTAFSDEAIKSGYQADILVKAGLTKVGENDQIRDFYKGRVVMPIHNLSGKVIGFGGRILKKIERAPKYINTPESEVYQKSKVLYGLYQSRQGIRRENYCLLVEGYTDVISLFQGGIDNVVASSGTSLTEDQIKSIKKFTEELVILYDGDTAGIKAALRGMDMVLEQGLNVKLVLLPLGEDPDSYIRTSGAQALKDFIKTNASDFILFKMALLLEETKGDPAKMSELVQEIVNSISKISDPIKRSLYIKECSVKLNVQEQLIIHEVDKKRRKKLSDDRKQTNEWELSEKVPILQKEVDKFDLKILEPVLECEKNICRLLLEYGKAQMNDEETVTDYIFNRVGDIALKVERYNFLFQHIRELYLKSLIMDVQYYFSNELKHISEIALELAAPPYELANWSFKNIDIELPIWGQNYLLETESTIAHFNIFKINKLIEENQMHLKKSELEKNEDEINLNIMTSIELQKMKKEWAEKVFKVI